MVTKLYIPALFVLLVTAFVSFRTGVPISEFTRDPAAITNASPFLGMLSNIGILFWCASATVCFFGAAVLRNRASSGELWAFLQSSGFITLVLMLDDLFLFHEEVIPRHFHIPQKAVLSAYAIAVLLYLVRFRVTILKTEFVALILALGFFGLSILVDVWLKAVLPWHHLFEDGFKLLGIVGWFGYFVRVCAQGIESVLLVD